MLSLERVSKVFAVGTFGAKRLHAVNDVSFQVGDREVVSLIGESGSGKSTIGKMILRLLSTSGGTIRFNGVDIAGLEGPALKDYYRHVQGVFQDPFSSYNPIFKADRIFHLIQDEFHPGIGQAEWTDKLDHSLQAVGLNPGDVLDKYPHQLSGGQLQRFLIARALLLDTQFLVADEIISMLDASTRIDVLNLLVDLKARGLSILFITHDLSLGYYISERAAILFQGCLTEVGSSERIFAHPLHPYTRMLVASVPRIDQKWGAGLDDRLARIDRHEPGPGCPYFTCCPISETVCAGYRPPLLEVEKDHAVACIHYEARPSSASTLAS
jgi:peptide/nickel transport system ATP-binding protein